MFECFLQKASIKLYKGLYGLFLNVTIFKELHINFVTFKI